VLTDRVPVGLRAARLAPSSRALAGIAAVLLLGLVFGGWLAWSGRPSTTVAPTVQKSRPAAATGGPSSGAGPASPELVVHVAGAVRRPGLVRLAAGARVADAIAAAGGPGRQAQLASVNLARPLTDGEQLLVLRKGEVPIAGTGAPAAGGPAAADAVVDLNTATLEQLDTLPGVGPVLAQRILDWRQQNGRFGSIDELREVAGIGDATFADLKPRVRV